MGDVVPNKISKALQRDLKGMHQPVRNQTDKWGSHMGLHMYVLYGTVNNSGPEVTNS